MSKRYTIEKDDERQVVGDLAGYDGWTVIAEEKGKKPDDLHEDDELDVAAGKWKRSPERKRRREKVAAAMDPAKVTARFDALEATIAELERRLSKA